LKPIRVILEKNPTTNKRNTKSSNLKSWVESIH